MKGKNNLKIEQEQPEDINIIYLQATTYDYKYRNKCNEIVSGQYNKFGYDIQGKHAEGYINGYDINGFNESGFSKSNEIEYFNGYDIRGFDKDGYNYLGLKATETSEFINTKKVNEDNISNHAISRFEDPNEFLRQQLIDYEDQYLTGKNANNITNSLNPYAAALSNFKEDSEYDSSEWVEEDFDTSAYSKDTQVCTSNSCISADDYVDDNFDIESFLKETNISANTFDFTYDSPNISYYDPLTSDYSSYLSGEN